jgi:hypothetical protein
VKKGTACDKPSTSIALSLIAIAKTRLIEQCMGRDNDTRVTTEQRGWPTTGGERGRLYKADLAPRGTNMLEYPFP